MKVYNTQAEVDADLVDGNLIVDDDVKFEVSVIIAGDINAGDINAGNINAYNIDAGNINACNINACNINAGDINAGDIDAGNINAGNINAGNINAGNIIAGNINACNIDAGDINAGDIDAGNINAYDINYFAFCTSYRSIKCTSHKARRNNAHSPICLDGKLTIKKATKQVTIDGVCKKFGCDIKIKKDQK